MRVEGAWAAKRRAALVSIVSNVCLTAAKLAAALASGSVSVLSEAAHSLGDIVASLLAWVSVRVSDKPADEDHPFGHGKVESLAGLAESLLLLGAATFVGLEAVERFRKPILPAVDLALAVVVSIAVVNALVARYLARVAAATDSEALMADAAHVRADFVTTLGVLIGLLLVRFTGNPTFDPIVASGVTLWIVWSAFRIAYRSLQFLADTSLPSEEVRAIEDILREHKGVLDWHQLRTRKSGSHRHVDGHILLEDSLSLVEAHAVTEEVEDLIRRALAPVSVTLHMEPYRREKAHRAEMHEDQADE